MKKINPQRITVDNQFRFFLCVTLFFIGLLVDAHRITDTLFPLTLLFVAYGLLLAGAHFVTARRNPSFAFPYIMIATDVTAITFAVSLTGRLESPLSILYLVVFGLAYYHKSVPQFVYAVVYTLALYSGMALFTARTGPPDIFLLLGQVLLIGILSGLLFFLLFLIDREKKRNARLLSQAQLVARVADALSGPVGKPKEAVKAVLTTIENDISSRGLHCRINIHASGEYFMAPSGGRTAVNIPILVGDRLGGTLSVLKKDKSPLSASDNDFFASIARTLGLYLHRAKIWEDFQKQLEKIEASLLLYARPGHGSEENRTLMQSHDSLKGMIDVVRIERGNWALQAAAIDFKNMVYEEIDRANIEAASKRIQIVMEGNFQNIPSIIADQEKLRTLFQHLFHNAISSTPPEGIIKMSVRYDTGSVNFTIEDQGAGGPEGPIPLAFDKLFDDRPFERDRGLEDFNWSLVICKKIVDVHKGTFWAESKGLEGGRLFSFSIPFSPENHYHAPLTSQGDVLESI